MCMLKRIWASLTADWEEEVPLPALRPSPAVRKHLVFSGVVQGVGFRFEAARLAQRLDLTGWVKNQASGSVEMELQGEEERLTLLVKQMRSIRRITVQSVTEERLSLVPGETEFTIKWE